MFATAGKYHGPRNSNRVSSNLNTVGEELTDFTIIDLFPWKPLNSYHGDRTRKVPGYFSLYRFEAESFERKDERYLLDGKR